ncbi:monofunctional biosynthetic peptidoglycan transglycosylase, partial [Escherichia coli]
VSAPSGYVHSRQAWILRQMYQLVGEPFMQQHQLE